MASPTIVAAGVGKRFLLHHKRATSLKERLLLHRQSSSEEFWALRDVDLEIGAGQTVGLIGPNGSGKSTLLKVLSSILAPTTGTVTVRGRIASLLELGAGFNGELTGRENIYLNAAILGLSRRETQRYFDDIVAFAELEPFIDNQVKHYSSGQYVRLGFAVAVHVSPDILLVDEVLAVGDEAFARKCLDKIAEFQRDGRTILFVSHSLDLVEQICDRVLVLEHGKLVYEGSPEFGVGRLRTILGVEKPPAAPVPVRDDSLQFGAITVGNEPGGPSVSTFTQHDTVAIRVEVELSDEWAAKVGRVQLTVMGVGNIPIWGMEVTDADLPVTGGRWVLDFVVKDCPPLSGRFIVGAQLATHDGTPIAHKHTSESFTVQPVDSLGLLVLPFTAELTVEAGPQ